ALVLRPLNPKPPPLVRRAVREASRPCSMISTTNACFVPEAGHDHGHTVLLSERKWLPGGHRSRTDFSRSCCADTRSTPSSRFSVVVAEEPAEPLAATHPAVVVGCQRRIDQHIPQPRMVSILVVVLQIL